MREALAYLSFIAIIAGLWLANRKAEKAAEAELAELDTIEDACKPDHWRAA